MNDELRERCANRLYRTAVEQPILYGRDACLQDVDAILDEIEAAGYVLMERGRAERLIEEARTMQAAYADGGWGESELQPGDLDPLEGGE